jgi:mannose-1-phosphate guanylyltransferase/mannose-6-phosphate isomerase
MPATRRVIALLLSGGAGTRLWPVSRPDCPKQFLKIFGDLSLYQLTLKRLRAAGVDEVFVAANRDHRSLLAKQADEIGEEAPTLILEPARRDSGPAIAAGVALARKRYGDEVIVCAMPCDHLIPDLARFSTTLKAAIRLARSGSLVTFGIAPTSPSTEYGYLQQGAALEADREAFKVDTFHEKPRLELAVQYVASGAFCWNSGMFVFQIGSFADEAARHMPEVWKAVTAAVAGSTRRGHIVSLAEAAFLSSPKISIDYGLFERSSNVAMVRAYFAWSDVGNWSSVFDSLEKTAEGNAVLGDARMRDCANTLVISEGVPVIAIGLSDVVILARPDGVLVSTRSRSAEVKDMIGG